MLNCRLWVSSAVRGRREGPVAPAQSTRILRFQLWIRNESRRWHKIRKLRSPCSPGALEAWEKLSREKGPMMMPWVFVAALRKKCGIW